MTMTIAFFLVASIATIVIAGAWWMHGIYRGRAFLMAVLSLLLFDRAMHIYNLNNVGFDPLSQQVRTLRSGFRNDLR